MERVSDLQGSLRRRLPALPLVRWCWKAFLHRRLAAPSRWKRCPQKRERFPRRCRILHVARVTQAQERTHRLRELWVEVGLQGPRTRPEEESQLRLFSLLSELSTACPAKSAETKTRWCTVVQMFGNQVIIQFKFKFYLLYIINWIITCNHLNEVIIKWLSY